MSLCTPPNGPPRLRTPVGAAVCCVVDARRVSKPWGEERWLVPESAPFGFKLITIRAGCRTSLQYHRRKEEAALVLSGEAVLLTGEPEQESLAETRVTDGDVMHLRPLVVHRIHAVTDVQLVETSTADLDDVVRLADDYARPDGRIRSEHHSKQ